MNIQQAKSEIAHALKAYLAKDSLGNYLIPAVRQRPVLLMGPPGVGKTQIMEQIAAEEGVGLVAYTITHHTRQSAMGLPFIQQRTYGGQSFSVTEYTMSEILSSVYRLMEETGLREGILFLDEINCVSETLAPMMLQFLQCKTFGNQRLPEGWLIVGAGNPPEYNRSVREFDVVTLDRVRRIDVEEDYGVWKDYARRKGLHGAVLSYLDIRREHFYHIETTVDGIQFATARGWEDLADLLSAYDRIGLRADRMVVEQYIRVPGIARDFANYLELYRKYQRGYRVDEILQGRWEAVTVSELRAAPFDEKLSVMGLLLSRLSHTARAAWRQDALTTALHADLTAFRDQLLPSGPDNGSVPDAGAVQNAASVPDAAVVPDSGSVPDAAALLEELAAARRQTLRQEQAAGHADPERRNLLQQESQTLETYRSRLRENAPASPEEAMDAVRDWFSDEINARERLGRETGQQVDSAFRFLEDALGQGQELVLFVTELTAGFHTSWFVETFGCDAYFRHNRELLFDDRRQRLRDRVLSARAAGQQNQSNP